MKRALFPLLLLSAAFAPAAPPSVILDNYISVGDNHWFGASLPIDSPASIEATFDLFHRLGMRRIYWRGLQEAAWLESMIFREENPRYFSFWQHLQALHAAHPIDSLAVQAAHRRGMEIWGVSTLYDWGGAADTPCFGDFPHNSECRLRIENPDWVPMDKYGVLRQGGPLEFSHPEARAALIALHVRLMKRDGYDGAAFLSYIENFNLRFPDEFGFSAPAVAEFKRRTGRDPCKQPFEIAASLHDWRRLRGEYLTAFLTEMKSALAALPGGPKPLGICVGPADPRQPQHWPTGGSDTRSGMAFSSGHIHFDIENWTRKGIVDQFLVWGGCLGTTQTDAVRDLLWLTRDTRTAVSPLTSSPHAERWQFAHEAGAPIMLSLADDAQYLLRCQVPEQTLAALTDKEPLLRMRILAQLVEALGTHSPEKTHPLVVQTDFAKIVPLVQDPNLIVRRLALEVLGKSKNTAVVPVIEAALDDPEVGIRSIAALALRHNHRAESAAAILSALARHPDHPTLESAIVALSRLQPPPREALGAALKHEKPAVRVAAIRSLRGMPHVDQLPGIIGALNDPDRYVRFSAAEAIFNYGRRPAVVEALLAALSHADPVVANRAATSLAALAAPSENNPIDSMRPQILTALRDLFAQHGDQSERTDRDWGYRPIGNALIKLGPEGEAILQSFMDQRADRRLAELAWKALHLRHQNNQFSEVSEEEDAAAHALRPVFEP